MAFVRIRHDAIDGEASVSEAAFLRLKPRGWVLADAQPDLAADAIDADLPMPQKNDKTAEWRAYAVHRGMPPEQAEQMHRDELVAYYTAPAATEES